MRCRTIKSSAGKTFNLSEYDFDDEIVFRLFEVDDFVSIQFKDGSEQDPANLKEFNINLHLKQLPLTFDTPISWFIQINTKQIRLGLSLSEDRSLRAGPE